MATFVIVHGAWGGGWSWKTVRNAVRAAGHDVFTPTLTGMGERSHLARPYTNLETHIQDAARPTTAPNLRPAGSPDRCGGQRPSDLRALHLQA